MKKILLFAFIFICKFSIAQFQQLGGNLTIFSEDGDAFYLVLNGEKQNEEPQTNIKIEDLPQPYYSAKIIFEDKKLATISRNALNIADGDGKMMDVTYRIKKDKNNKVKLNFYSMIPVPLDFVPPAGMFVRHFGQPINGNVNFGNNQPRNNGNNGNNGSGFGANVNMPGVNLNISISDPDLNDNPRNNNGNQNNNGGNNNNNNNQNTNSNQAFCRVPMSSADFLDAKKTINESSFDETKLSTAKSIISSNCVSVEQVIGICSLFSFEDKKLDFAKFAYGRTTDPRNYFKVVNVLTFSDSKEELNEYIQNQR